MKVLYVTTKEALDARVVLADLLRLEPEHEVRTVEGAAGALVEIRAAGGYSAIFVSPSVPHNEALGLISSLRRDRAPIAIVAILTETDRAFSPRAITAGADDVLVLKGKRLVDVERTLKLVRLTSALYAAEARIGTLSEAAQSATLALTALRADHDELREAQAFERALRDRDRAELAAVTRELLEERDRRIVMEGTLAQTEDHAKADRVALQEDVAAAADRLHQVAHDTQSLQTRLERQLAERVAERDRLTDNALIGHAVLARGGQLVRCSDMFAEMLGYADADDAVRASAGRAFPGTPDHAGIVARLDAGGAIDRVESTLRRADGRPVRVLTSAALLTGAGDAEPQIERLFVDLSEQAATEVELRLARRLEAAGRLAAEMAGQLEAAVATLEGEGHSSPAQDELALLVRQLVAFSRHQAKPAGFLSLNDAIARTEPALRQIAGGAIEFQISLGNIEPVAAGEDDLEQLLIDAVTAVAACLPFGGRLTLTTTSDTDSTFVLRTTISVTAAGYGVLPCVTSSSLVRHTARCGGSLRISGEAGRSSTLHVHLPC